jgi:hypothetical protein
LFAQFFTCEDGLAFLPGLTNATGSQSEGDKWNIEKVTRLVYSFHGV